MNFGRPFGEMLEGTYCVDERVVWGNEKVLFCVHVFRNTFK